MYIDHKAFDAALNTTTRAAVPALMNKPLFMAAITPLLLVSWIGMVGWMAVGGVAQLFGRRG